MRSQYRALQQSASCGKNLKESFLKETNPERVDVMHNNIDLISETYEDNGIGKTANSSISTNPL